MRRFLLNLAKEDVRPSGNGWISLAVSEGTIVYTLGKPPSSGIGVSWSSSELDLALKNEVTAVLFDDDGKIDIVDLLAGLQETEFSRQEIEKVLSEPEAFEDWRVGEAIAETYLAEHRSCSFPWPDTRDARKSGSSLPGADLVGFAVDGDGDCLAFGEVKSSSQASYPPTTMFGRSGLKNQLEDLRDSEHIRKDLVRYLGHRARQAPWEAEYISSVHRYIRDRSDFRLFGILIRDVPPDEADLRARVEELSKGRRGKTSIELLALYLPEPRLSGIGTSVVAIRKAAGE